MPDVILQGAGSFGYCEPSLVTFNTLISACGKAGKYTEALQVHSLARGAACQGAIASQWFPCWSGTKADAQVSAVGC